MRSLKFYTNQIHAWMSKELDGSTWPFCFHAEVIPDEEKDLHEYAYSRKEYLRWHGFWQGNVWRQAPEICSMEIVDDREGN